MGLGQGQRGRRVGDVAHLGRTPCFSACATISRKQPSWDAMEGCPGFVGAGEVRPQADDPDQAVRLGSQGLGDEFRPVRGLAAGPPEAGVGLEVDAGRHAGGGRGLTHLFQGPQITHGHVDVGLDRAAPRPAGGPEPAQDTSVQARLAQRERLLGRGGAEPLGTGFEGGAGARHRPVAVRVRLHHGHQGGAGSESAQGTDVRPQSRQVDLGTGAQRCRLSTCHRAPVSQRAPPPL